MVTASNLPDGALAGIVNRLKKIEGQARGIRTMIEDDRECVAILDQIASIKSAVNGLSGEMLEVFALHCLIHPDEFGSPEKTVELMVRMLVRAGR